MVALGSRRDVRRTASSVSSAKSSVSGQLRYFVMYLNEYGFSESRALTIANGGALLKLASMVSKTAEEVGLIQVRELALHAEDPVAASVHFASGVGAG